ncbi:MAG TPA: hypothetical protein ENK36_06195, partial [Desulfobacterales bacterium]|nr:hypothetical protein [Desulfobacterales bacterium]
MISKQNKKLTLGILLTFIICIGSAIFAAYSTGPYGNYPNPGHHPGEIGPGTFNASGVFIPNWSFPDSTGNRFSGFEIINGEGQFYKGLQIDDYVGAPIDFLVRGDTQLGDDSSDKITVKGDLNVSGGLKVGDSSTTCDSSTEGTVKYNYEEHRLELCNSTDWVSVSGGISCVNLCPSEGDTRCIGAIQQTCGNYDADICLEWGNDTNCSVDCSCSCGDYGKTTEVGFCSDGKDNDCDGFTDSNDCDCIGTGTCSCTGTEWCGKKISGDIVYVDCNANKCWSPTPGSTYTWSNAIDYCNNLSYGGFTDWVLPDKTTLENLCHSDSCSGTCFDGEGYSGPY